LLYLRARLGVVRLRPSVTFFYILVCHTNHADSGVEYGTEDIFDLTQMAPYNLDKLYKSFTKYSNEVVLYLPRNSDLNQIARYAKDEKKKLEVAHYAIMGASKVSSCALVVVLGM
jgi:hypothetical protein